MSAAEPKIVLELSPSQAQQLVNILGRASAPWTVTNPFIVAILSQMPRAPQLGAEEVSEEASSSEVSS